MAVSIRKNKRRLYKLLGKTGVTTLRLDLPQWMLKLDRVMLEAAIKQALKQALKTRKKGTSYVKSCNLQEG